MRPSQIAAALLNKVPVYFTKKESYEEEELFSVNSIVIDNKEDSIHVTNEYEDTYNISKLKFFSQREYENYIKPVYYKNKAPTSKCKYLGIEIEFASKIGRLELCELISKKGLSSYVTVAEDGSIETEEDFQTDIEVKILVKQSQYKVIVPKILKVLRKVGKVNESCGLHVHLDMRYRKVRECFSKLVENVDKLSEQVDPERVGGEYCRTNHISDMEEHLKYSSGRYWAINAASYNKHKTLEVRMKESTLDTKEVLTWIETLIKTVDN